MRLASEADVDADLKAKQAQAKRAQLLFKLKQGELKAVGGAPQPLGGQASTVCLICSLVIGTLSLSFPDKTHQCTADPYCGNNL